jgi:hypothetical protein
MQIWSTIARRGTLLVFLILSAPGTGAAMDQAKHDDIKLLVKELHELDDALKGFDASLKRSIDGFRKQKPNIPDTVWDAAIEDARQEFVALLPDLEEPIIAIYDANYTADEIKQLLAFYRSPIGQKVIAQSSQIEEQTTAVAKVLGERLRPRISERIRQRAKEKGYDL